MFNTDIIRLIDGITLNILNLYQSLTAILPDPVCAAVPFTLRLNLNSVTAATRSDVTLYANWNFQAVLHDFLALTY